MDHSESPLFNNLLKLCDTEDEPPSVSKVSRTLKKKSQDGPDCASCVSLWRDGRYYNWSSMYTRSSLCADCQEGRARQDYISYWGSSKYRVGSWRLRQKWISPDLGWMLTSRTETDNDTSRSQTITERSWTQDFTARSCDSIARSVLSARSQGLTPTSSYSISQSDLSARSQEVTPRSTSTFKANPVVTNSDSNIDNIRQGKNEGISVGISIASKQGVSTSKLQQERHPRSKSPSLQKVDIASRKRMFEQSSVEVQSEKVSIVDCSRNEAAKPTVTDIPKLDLSSLDDTPYNSPVYHFPLTPKHIPTIAKPNRWVGYGYFVGTAELTSDTGHLLWVRPRGDLQVIFRYADTGQDFKCFVDPQYTGVKLSQRKPDGELTVILDGKESPGDSSSNHRVASVTRYPPQNNFKLESYLGRIELLLQAVRNDTIPNTQRFKFNFTLTL
ncbi:uncharacterized protein [Argopecten irradians]|uniref:uncharacterized protein n=1 Tax=Argopecten irradians TaxID=31199 RepID=UPI00371DCD40